MYNVKIQFIGFAGNEKKYPCHFGFKPGDEVIFDGEKYIGKLCPDVWPVVAPKVYALFIAGPRHIEPNYYYPHWYAPASTRDPKLKKYDGLGFRNVLKTQTEPPYHMSCTAPPGAWEWPPHNKRDIARDIVVSCPDPRTVALFKIEAFDLGELGYNAPWYRREMEILGKVLAKPGIAKNKILNEFSKKENEGIYPALSPVLIDCLLDELELMGYLVIKNNVASVTKKGKVKFNSFKASLSEEERKALNI